MTPVGFENKHSRKPRKFLPYNQNSTPAPMSPGITTSRMQPVPGIILPENRPSGSSSVDSGKLLLGFSRGSLGFGGFLRSGGGSGGLQSAIENNYSSMFLGSF